jgi:integrase/recombinase XerD
MIDEAVNIYVNLLGRSGYHVNTVSTKKTVLTNFTVYLNENNIKDLKEIDITVIEKFFIYLAEKGFKDVTIKNHRKRIKEFFNYLLERKKIEGNPFEKEKKNYPSEFEQYISDYLKLKSLEDTCFNSMKKIKLSLNLFYSFLTAKEITKHSEVKKEDLTDFIKYLVDLPDKKGNPVYKTTSVNRMLASLKPYIQWLSKKGVFATGFSSTLSYLKKTQRLTRNILTRKELVALFNLKTTSLYEFMMKLIFIVQYASGLRINELLSITLSDIDFESCTLKIFETKTKKERVVQIGEVGAKYLKIFIDEIRPKVCYDHNASDIVFLSYHEGKTLNDNTVNRYLKAFCKKAGITKAVTCHCFRHSYGTHLLENGLGIKEVSDLMGHRDLTSTEQYTRLSPERLRKTINLFHPLEMHIERSRDEENQSHVES